MIQCRDCMPLVHWMIAWNLCLLGTNQIGGAGLKHHTLQKDYPRRKPWLSVLSLNWNLHLCLHSCGLKWNSNVAAIVFLMLQPCDVLCYSFFDIFITLVGLWATSKCRIQPGEGSFPGIKEIFKADSAINIPLFSWKPLGTESRCRSKVLSLLFPRDLCIFGYCER